MNKTTKLWRKSLSVLLSILMLAALIPMIDLPTAFADTWDGTYTDGSGFSNNTITSARGLAYFLNRVANGNTFSGQTVYLATDVNLNERDLCDAIPYYTNGFEGTFDGQNHTISNFRMTHDNHRVAMFRTAKNATFKNVTVTNVFVDDWAANNKKNGFAVFVGYGEGNLTFENVHVSGGYVYGYNYVGGLVGEYGADNILTFTNCSNSALIHADNDRAAGMVGHSKGRVYATSCSNTGEIYAGYSDAGGLAGWIEDDESYFVNCSNTGNVSTDSAAGGMVGYFGSKSNDNKMTITGCINRGNITSRKSSDGGDAGGMAGKLDTDAAHEFANNVNYGQIVATGESAGGMVGANMGGGTWNNCRNYGNIYGNGDNAGGLLGEIEDDVQTFYNCLNAGYVESRYTGGGIMGWGSDGKAPSFERCFNYGNVSAGSYGGGILGGHSGGSSDNHNNFIECMNAGSVESSDNGGGMVGEGNWTYITRCFNMGSISRKGGGTSKAYGGLIGWDVNDITDSYNVGNVTYGDCTGGIMGGDTHGSYNNCYNAGNCTGGNKNRQIKAQDSSGSFTNCWSCSSVSGETQWSVTDANGLKDLQNTLNGNVYCKDTWGINNGYPILKWWRDNYFKFPVQLIDGSTNVVDTTYNYNAGFTAPARSKTGYTFNGWYTASSGGSKVWGPSATTVYAGVTAPMNSCGMTWNTGDNRPNVLPSTNPLKYYAQYTPNPYTIRFNGGGANFGSMDNLSMVYDTPKNLPANGFIREYTVTYNYNYPGSTNSSDTAVYTFAGWARTEGGAKDFDNNQSVNNLTSTKNDTVDLYALWNPGSVTLPSPTRTGYSFNGWYTDEACTEANKLTGPTYTPTENKTLYAGWTINTYAVTLIPTNGGYTVTTEPASTVNHGGSVSFTITLSEGYTNSNAPNATVTNGDRNVTRSGNEITYTISNITGETVIRLFDATLNSYTVTFKGWNGDTLKTETVIHGGNATPPAIPDRAPDDTNHYTPGTWTGYTNITGDTELTAPYTAEAHTYSGAPVWGAWTDENTVTATFTCDHCAHTYAPDVTVTPAVTAPTCTADGYTVYTASVSMNGVTYTNSTEKTVVDEGSHTGHTYNAPAESDWSWTWDATNETYIARVTLSCAKNDDTRTVDAEVSLTGHQDAGHLTDGYNTYTAAVTVGNQTFTAEKTDNLTAEGHSWTFHEAAPAAVCTETGTVAYWSCGGCSVLLDADQQNEITDTDDHTAGPHDWEWVTDTPATCGAAGIKHEKCKNCTATQSENTPISATGNHSYTEAAVKDEAKKADANCTDPAVYYYSCVVCGAVEGDDTHTFTDGAANGHAWEWVADTPATCGEAGVQHEKCKNCTATQSENTPSPATGNHSFTDAAVKAEAKKSDATCTDPAVYYYSCAVCGAVEGDDAHTFTDGAANGHAWEWVTDTPATCGAAGVQHEKCKNCTATQSENTPISATGNHSYTAETVKDEAKKADATCTDPAKYYYSCAVCGAVEGDDAHIFTVGEKNDHSLQYNSNENGTHTITCENCDLNETADCNYNETPHAATCTAGAYITYACKNCGYTYDGEPGEPNGHSYGAPSWSWESETKAVATFVCAQGDDTQTVTAEGEAITSAVITEPTSTEEGLERFTASVSFNGTTYTGTYDKVLPSTGHIWSDPVWEWEGTSKATATFTCSHCTEVKTVTAEGDAITREPVIYAAGGFDGVDRFTATVTFNGVTYRNAIEETIPSAGAQKIHGDHCFCYGYTNSDIFGRLIIFICSLFYAFRQMFSSLGM